MIARMEGGGGGGDRDGGLMLLMLMLMLCSRVWCCGVVCWRPGHRVGSSSNCPPAGSIQLSSAQLCLLAAATPQPHRHHHSRHHRQQQHSQHRGQPHLTRSDNTDRFPVDYFLLIYDYWVVRFRYNVASMWADIY